VAQDSPPPGKAAQAILLAGGIALLAGGAVDFISVIGRHIGHPFLGSIEIVQLCVVVAASTSLLAATLGRVHATVHVLVERLPFAARRQVARIGSLLGFVLFAIFFVGSAWVVTDVAGGDERSDLLGLPILPFRILWCLAAAATALVFLAQAIRPKVEENTHDA
jgi:TRAP-type C4-dicarboxylate transport system permease small subunit